ncbi:hypothetical protein GJ496_001043 [Pomphorhynchus laevis]|nr:hypothetical protein GJ496_001043 [Pomphorhynchus laevis]
MKTLTLGSIGYRILRSVKQSWNRSIIYRANAYQLPCSANAMPDKAAMSLFCIDNKEIICWKTNTDNYVSVPKDYRQEWTRFRIRWWKKLLRIHESVNLENDVIAYKFQQCKNKQELNNVFENCLNTNNDQVTISVENMFSDDDRFIFHINVHTAMRVFLFDAFNKREIGDRQLLELHSELCPFHFSIFYNEQDNKAKEMALYFQSRLGACGLYGCSYCSDKSLQQAEANSDGIGIPVMVIFNDESSKNGFCDVRLLSTGICEKVHYAVLPKWLFDYYNIAFVSRPNIKTN